MTSGWHFSIGALDEYEPPWSTADERAGRDMLMVYRSRLAALEAQRNHARVEGATSWRW